MWALVGGIAIDAPPLLMPVGPPPPMNSPNAPLCRSIHSRAGLSLSGAGPYAIVSNISETVVMSYHGMVMRRRVASGHEVLELALDVGEQRRRAQSEQIGPQPAIPQLFLH